MRLTGRRFLLFGGLLLGCWHSAAVLANDVPEERQYLQWIAMLDSDSSQRRQYAWENLSRALHSGIGTAQNLHLLSVVRRELREPELSFELQEKLFILENELKSLLETQDQPVPEMPADPVETVSWKTLVDDLPSRRSQTRRQIEEQIRHGDGVCETMVMLRQIIVSENLSEDDRMHVWALFHQARMKWLADPDRRLEADGLSESRILEMLQSLASVNLPEDKLVPWMNLHERTTRQFSVRPNQEPLGGDGFAFLSPISRDGERLGLAVWLTVQSLEDALISGRYAGFTQKKIQEMLRSRKMTPSGTILLSRLAFLTKPCLAAEYWTNGEMKTAQFLQVGVPQNCGVGTSYFDRMSGDQVHCEEGMNLAAGDYALNAAVRHPNQKGSFFHFVKLETLEEKLLYPQEMRKQAAVRWREISEKTLARLDAECRKDSRILTPDELLTLELLEPQALSIQIGRWLGGWNGVESVVRVGEMEEAQSIQAHLCRLLLKMGTREAVSGLENVLEKDISWKSMESESKIAWLAMLTIARRDPWEGVRKSLENWLTEDLELVRYHWDQKEDSPMVLAVIPEELHTEEDGPMTVSSEPGIHPKNIQLSASAAGILLEMRETEEGMPELLDRLTVRYLPIHLGSGKFYLFEDENVRHEVLEKLRKK